MLFGIAQFFFTVLDKMIFCFCIMSSNLYDIISIYIAQIFFLHHSSGFCLLDMYLDYQIALKYSLLGGICPLFPALQIGYGICWLQ
jgi:hypothetical protein